MSILFGLSLFLIILVSWRHLSPSGILFFQGCAAAILSAALQLTIVIVKSKIQAKPRLFKNNIPIKDALITFLVAYAFMFTIPTTVDRAYSVKLILRLQGEAAGLTSGELERWFAKEFSKADGVERRLHEQIVTGSICQQDNRYMLTSRGRLLARSFHFVQQIFSCSPVNQ